MCTLNNIYWWGGGEDEGYGLKDSAIASSTLPFCRHRTPETHTTHAGSLKHFCQVVLVSACKFPVLGISLPHKEALCISEPLCLILAASFWCLAKTPLSGFHPLSPMKTIIVFHMTTQHSCFPPPSRARMKRAQKRLLWGKYKRLRL